MRLNGNVDPPESIPRINWTRSVASLELVLYHVAITLSCLPPSPLIVPIPTDTENFIPGLDSIQGSRITTRFRACLTGI